MLSCGREAKMRRSLGHDAPVKLAIVSTLSSLSAAGLPLWIAYIAQCMSTLCHVYNKKAVLSQGTTARCGALK